eukprot:8226638-Alexandrium_andersonii.AAC.1
MSHDKASANLQAQMRDLRLRFGGSASSTCSTASTSGMWPAKAPRRAASAEPLGQAAGGRPNVVHLVGFPNAMGP